MACKYVDDEEKQFDEDITESLGLKMSNMILDVENELNELKIYYAEGMKQNDTIPLELWFSIVKHIKLTGNFELTELCYSWASKLENTDVALNARLEYLKWSWEHKGGADGTRVFNEVKDLEPPSKELYLTMIGFQREPYYPVLNIKNVRKLYEEVTKKLGKRDIDLWLSWVRFEYDNCEYNIGVPVYEKALKTLDDELRLPMRNSFFDIQNEYTGGEGFDIADEFS